MYCTGQDHFIRIWDRTTECLVGCIQEFGRSRAVAFSADDRFVVHTNGNGLEAKIVETNSQELVFDCKNSDTCQHGMSQNAALMVVRSCGPKSSWMLPLLWDRAPGDVFFIHHKVYFEGENICTYLLTFPPGLSSKWELSSIQGTLVTTVDDRLVISRLVR